MIHPIQPRKHVRGQYNTAFVLTGGAARGAIQVGMLQVLLQRGIVPDLVVGTSVGSFNGVWLADHPTVEGMKSLEHVWSRVRFDHIFPGGPVGMLLHLLQHRPSLYADEGIRSFIKRAATEGGFFDCSFEELQVPLAVVATNLTRGRPEVFRSGPVAPALLASAAIPAMLPPVTINGEQFVDGGLLDNVGLRVAIEHGAEQIYVLDTSWDGTADHPVTTFESVIQRSMEVVMSFHLQSALESFAQRADVVLLRSEKPVAANANDFSATAELIAAGRAVAERVLAAPERETVAAMQRRQGAAQPARIRATQWSGWPRAERLRQAVAHAPLVRQARVFGHTLVQGATSAKQQIESSSQQAAS